MKMAKPSVNFVTGGVVLVFGFLVFFFCCFFGFFPTLVVLKKWELLDVLMRDDDGYYATLGETDLLVRGASSVEDYRGKMMVAPCNLLGLDEWFRLYWAVLRSWWFFMWVSVPGFDGWACNRLPYVVGFVSGAAYEGGHPHVRWRSGGLVPVIVLPRSLLSSPRLSSTLSHEKIHVYQKSYPALTSEYFVRNGFVRVGVRSSANRANPDLDPYLYSDSAGRVMQATYTEGATQIMDVVYSPVNESRYEHPLEYMAYTIEKGL